METLQNLPPKPKNTITVEELAAIRYPIRPKECPLNVRRIKAKRLEYIQRLKND